MGIIGNALTVSCGILALAAAALWLARREQWARLATVLSLLAVLAAVALMEFALLARDTAVDYVVKVTEEALPAYYRFTALWSAMEGSLLFWLLCLAIVTVAFVVHGLHRLPPRMLGAAAAVLCAFVAAFAAVSIVASPFTLAEGSIADRPSPLLQDHAAMGIHPPLLYLGFTALAIPFALSCAALLTRSTGAAWARLMRGWTVVAWIPLTAGILLGAWWSYAVLGWGGYWAWDPVENASLMPWLMATALLHVTGPRMRSAGWRPWAIVLGGAAFALVVLATFLTRSGVIQSIHAFSVSPLGPLLLAVLLAAVTGWVVLALHGRSLFHSDARAAVLSRQTALQINRVALALVTLIVLAGSLLPTVVLAVSGDRLSVGPPWYERTLAPLAVVLLVVMAVGPWLRWGADSVRSLLGRIWLPAVTAAATSGVVALVVRDVVLALAAGLTAFVLVSLVVGIVRRAPGRRRRAGALLAHLGVAIAALAVVGSGIGAVTERTVAVGQTVLAGDTSATLVSVDRVDDGRRDIAEARLLLERDGESLGEARPQLRWYEEHSTMLAAPEIRPLFFDDVYVTLLDFDPVDTTATIRLAVNPLVSWLWVAGGVAVAGAAIAAWPARPRRGGVPSTRSTSGHTGVPDTAVVGAGGAAGGAA
ncbi:cytochrome c biogenesis protein CcsA [Salinibacterium sp. SYSU T00001]|uniref:cytochrome c-type biogenesis CcmF C-terminal domain-containing protein n=1 Tax=Homoserinimonas sedimenticola TaxID=2986805 RepID=UPI002236845D|nr:cytochrome c-type biogenesis CcmF C-terminal domain-containing protein [Salinibacterium sedimenticola]MCW4384778.1 cytochrome c biogenesis protein CcsA [Salinibacterium sedimenticola]